MAENYEETVRRLNELNQIIRVDFIWECDVMRELKSNKEMKAFFEDPGNERGCIQPRSAYFGGRTGPQCLYAEADENYTISFFDIISLYPFINFSTK